MSIVKPYTFVPGTKARANEVNENFDRLYEQVNTNITNIAENATDITNLGIDKADVQGNSTQRFAVADATSSYDAINKQTAMKYISNSVNIIGGLVITKDSESPYDTIIVDVGACYDSEKDIVMQLTASVSKKNEDQLGNANYYVYLISDNNGSNPDVLISTSSTVPTLPSGYTKYRQIGYFKTDGSAKIESIYYYGIDGSSDKSINGMINSIMPSYSNITSQIRNTTYQAPKDGYVWAMAHTAPGGQITLTINNVPFIIGRSTKAETACGSGSMFNVTKGDEYILSGGFDVTGIFQLYFIPCKGVV